MARDVVEGRLSKADAARTYGVTAKVVARWVERFRAEGSAGMIDRSSRPKTSPKQTEAAVADAITALRRQRLTGKHIAMQTGVSEATVSRVPARAGLSRLKDLEPAEPVRRYEREHPGELIHLDIKIAGPDRLCGAPHHWAISWRSQPPSRHRLGVRPRLHRRCLARCFRPSHARPTQGERCRLPRSCYRLLRQPRHQSAARDDRQRLLLPLKSFPGSLQASGSASDLHQAVHAKDQWKG